MVSPCFISLKEQFSDMRRNAFDLLFLLLLLVFHPFRLPDEYLTTPLTLSARAHGTSDPDRDGRRLRPEQEDEEEGASEQKERKTRS